MSSDFERPRFPDVVTAHERTIQAAVDNPQTLNRYTTPRPTRPESQNGEVVSRTLDPRVLQYAMQVANGDTRRLVIHEDGGITIANHPQRSVI